MKSSRTTSDLQFARRVALWAKQNSGVYQPKVLQGRCYFFDFPFKVTNSRDCFSLSAKTPSTSDTL
jgi:hypothetical protein